MDERSGVIEAFCRGEEDGLLSVKKVRFVRGRRNIHISEEIICKYIIGMQKRVVLRGCYMTLSPWLRFGRKLKGYKP